MDSLLTLFVDAIGAAIRDGQNKSAAEILAALESIHADGLKAIATIKSNEISDDASEKEKLSSE